MSITFAYKGYIGKVEIDPEDNIFYGSVINTRDIITFTAETVPEIYQAFHDSVEEYLAWAAEDNFLPEIRISNKHI